MRNYNINLLPIEALKFNLNIIYPKKKFLEFNIVSEKLVSAKRSLKDRLYFINLALKNGYYEHHVFGKKMLEVPLKINDQSLKQFITHISYMLNIPILFLSSINKSVHKKKSFKIFYKIIKNKEIESFVKKHENFRKNWRRYKSNSIINKKIYNYFGKNYFHECKKIIQAVIKKIEIYNK